MLGEDPGGLGRGRGPLPTGEVVKDVGEGSEWLLSRGLAGARSKGKKDKERKKRKEGKVLTTRLLWVRSGIDLRGYALVAMWTVQRIVTIDVI